MPEIVADCPRCGASSVTFDLAGANWVGQRYDWQNHYEAFSICRHCHAATVLQLSQSTSGFGAKVGTAKALADYQGALNNAFEVCGYVSLKDMNAEPPPEHLPEHIDAAFREGATCMTVKCYNAAGTMFRLCLDFATKELMPAEDVDGLNGKIRRSLGLRMNWLFDTKRLPEALRELATCVKDDGNDGAHDGTLTEIDAEDLQEFTFELLERMYTEAKRLEIAKARRDARHKKVDA